MKKVLFVLVTALMLFGCGSNKKVEFIEVTDEPTKGEEVSMVVKMSNYTHEGKTYSLMNNVDSQNYRINIEWEKEDTEIEINETYEITCKFGGKEDTGFEGDDMIQVEFNVYECNLNK